MVSDEDFFNELEEHYESIENLVKEDIIVEDISELDK